MQRIAPNEFKGGDFGNVREGKGTSVGGDVVKAHDVCAADDDLVVEEGLLEVLATIEEYKY